MTTLWDESPARRRSRKPTTGAAHEAERQHQPLRGDEGERWYDKRRYPIVGVREGYRESVRTYKQSVQDEMDLRLLDRLQTVDWSAQQSVLDTPGGFELFFKDFGERLRQGPVGLDELNSLGKPHGIRFLDDWIPDLKAAYNLRVIGQ